MSYHVFGLLVQAAVITAIVAGIGVTAWVGWEGWRASRALLARIGCGWCSCEPGARSCRCAQDCGAPWCTQADATLAMLRQPQPAPWPDGDTVIAGGLSAELNEMLKGDGRG
jgi:hypothetical protein